MPHLAYGWSHQKVRAQLIAELRAMGTALCPICCLPMTADMKLHLHHSNPAAKRLGLPGDVLAHAKCNLGYGDGSRAGKRKTAGQSRRW